MRRQGVGIVSIVEGVDLRWVRSAAKPSSGVAQVLVGLPITAVPATIPRTSKLTAAWLRLGSVMSTGWSTR